MDTEKIDTEGRPPNHLFDDTMHTRIWEYRRQRNRSSLFTFCTLAFLAFAFWVDFAIGISAALVICLGQIFRDPLDHYPYSSTGPFIEYGDDGCLTDRSYQSMIRFRGDAWSGSSMSIPPDAIVKSKGWKRSTDGFKELRSLNKRRIKEKQD